ncbi:MAG: hypothetical protein J6P40_10730 [Oscillospiraceae bacterium]|nr:hypothetical protein [Oscillospiraceae bacterium]
MIDNDDMSRLREVFVTRQECETDMKTMDDKISAEAVRLAVIEQQLKTITWILCTIGAGVMTTLIKLFLGA